MKQGTTTTTAKFHSPGPRVENAGPCHSRLRAWWRPVPRVVRRWLAMVGQTVISFWTNCPQKGKIFFLRLVSYVICNLHHCFTISLAIHVERFLFLTFQHFVGVILGLLVKDHRKSWDFCPEDLALNGSLLRLLRADGHGIEKFGGFAKGERWKSLGQNGH